ncbi:glycerophosphodiester phosphodiesterase [Arthrobacter gandavensis]|uniref:glycerophosphodiester phosphodiesterase n=1 Tax=Arthrobacter gandavensis TaxID=169960 RepID=UPI001890AE8C|nr:glycerophosphodiester phosphodiesterase family protein [Arthrobacter gandavensis]MBF4993862.1 glycerophosphodiester phosphodiesterase [Arthrobacter gandavensis]
MNLLNIAHRGNSSRAPENTLAAFASAAAAGAGMIETDLQLSADGTIVLIHDETLDRTGGRNGRVAELSGAALREADAGSWFSSEYAGEGIPDLEDLARFASANPQLRWLLEFKGEWTPEQAGVAARTLRETGIAGRCVLQGFSRHTVRSLYEAAPDIDRGLLIVAAPAPARQEPLLEFLAETASSYCNPHGGVLRASPNLVPMLHAAGVQVLVWTLNEAGQWTEAAGAGVDGIITDRPGELAAWSGTDA